VPRPPLDLDEVRAVNDALDAERRADRGDELRARAPVPLKGGDFRGAARRRGAAGARPGPGRRPAGPARGGVQRPVRGDPTTFADAREIVRRRRVALPQRAVRLLEGALPKRR